MRDNIVLIGMPASGKSTAGLILAKLLGYDFIDSDLVIQKEAGALLKDLISERGADGFISYENEVNRRIEAEKAVIATGGSAVYGMEAMQHFKDIGVVLYLKVPFDVIRDRLDDIQQRGVVFRDGQSFEELYMERCALYEAYADIVVDETGKTVEEIVSEIKRTVELWRKFHRMTFEDFLSDCMFGEDQ